MPVELSILIYIIIPLITGLVGYIFHSILKRLDSLEEKIVDTIDENGVRLIVDDKIDPVSTDIAEIKTSLNHLIELYCKSRE